MKLHYNKNNPSNWNGPISTLGFILKVITFKIKWDTEIWYQELCESTPPVDKPEDCDHTKKAYEIPSWLSYLFPIKKIQSTKNKAITIVKYSFGIISISFFAFKLISITIFSFQFNSIYYHNEHHQHIYSDNLEKVLENLRNLGRIDPTTQINTETKPIKKWSFWGERVDLISNYTIECYIDDFRPGEYDVTGAKNTFEAIKIFINHLKYNNTLFNTNGKIIVEVIGETDNLLFSQARIYDGKYGDFLNYTFLLNKKVDKISLKTYDTYNTNRELAFLRAYSTWGTLKSMTELFALKETQASIKAIINEKNTGSQYRKIQVRITLEDVTQ